MTQDIKPVKTAIVGCGAISDIFFQNFTQRFQIIDLVKCCSRRLSSAETRAKQYGVQACAMEDILADPEIELLVNLTPAGAHFDIIKAGLEAGKHIYTEKVITPDYRMTKELVELAQSKNLLFGSEPDHFLGSSWQCAAEYIEAGIIGDVTSIVTSVCQNQGVIADRLRFVAEPGGGIGYDYGIYLITQLVSLLGPAVEVSGVMTTLRPQLRHMAVNHPDFLGEYTYPNEDMATASILFASGAVAVLHMNGSSILEGPKNFWIYGTQGALSMPLASDFSGEVQLYRPGSFEPLPVLPAHGFDHDSRGVGAADLAWSLRLGRTPRADAHLGLHCQEIIQGISESFKTRQFYRLTTTCERPRLLQKGFRKGIPGFSHDEESALAL